MKISNHESYESNFTGSSPEKPYKAFKFSNLSNIKSANKMGYLSNGQVLSMKKNKNDS